MPYCITWLYTVISTHEQFLHMSGHVTVCFPEAVVDISDDVNCFRVFGHFWRTDSDMINCNARNNRHGAFAVHSNFATYKWHDNDNDNNNNNNNNIDVLRLAGLRSALVFVHFFVLFLKQGQFVCFVVVCCVFILFAVLHLVLSVTVVDCLQRLVS